MVSRRSCVMDAVVKHVNDGYDIRSHVTGTRWFRSIPGIGGSVVKAIMKGTTEVGTKSPLSRKFLKQGTTSDAIKDFNSLNSDVISQHGYGATGFVGDTKFKLRLNDNNNRGLPTLQIWDPNMTKSIKIHYMDKPIVTDR